MTPYEAPSLARFKQALNTRWPGRDHSSDGWIGDTAHQETKSGHNPSPPSGVVRARDTDVDGIHVPSVVASLLLNPAIRYAIYNERIFHARDQFRPKKYTGSNKHDKHIHGEIESTKMAENSKAPWVFISTVPRWTTLKAGMNGESIRQLQALLNGHGSSLALDSEFGPGTLDAVKRFQNRKGLQKDGWVGSKTYTALRTR